MNLLLFKTMWGVELSFEDAIKQLLSAHMDGLETAVPEQLALRQQLSKLIEDNDLKLIAEITTAGSYVPERYASLQEHLDTFKHKLEISCECTPEFITCLGGCDAWPESQSIDFFHAAMEIADSFNIGVSFETHRSRSLFNPWVTQRIVEQIPGIQLTLDISHWCVVCERLMDTELPVINAIADNVRHIHARIGYDQGPQVPDPRAPEYNHALLTHQQCWEIIWRSQYKRNFNFTTMTAEFGPDGYLHELPFSRQPVADLWDLNQWMAQQEAQHFARLKHHFK